jgi:predicted CopG family antitoxin
LSDEFFDGAESGINVRVKVISERNSNDIINQYIIFCKVFDEQRRRLGLTEEMVRATIDICRNKDVLREYLNNREKEVYMIMTSCFDQEVEMKLYIASVRREVREETIAEMKEESKREVCDMAERMIRKGRMSIEEIAECVPSLSIEELKEIEAQVTTQDTANI